VGRAWEGREKGVRGREKDVEILTSFDVRGILSVNAYALLPDEPLRSAYDND
jgi:hypothetical protein